MLELNFRLLIPLIKEKVTFKEGHLKASVTKKVFAYSTNKKEIVFVRPPGQAKQIKSKTSKPVGGRKPQIYVSKRDFAV